MAVETGDGGADPRSHLVLDAPFVERIEHAVIGLDAWFESMRQPDGYGGPVVHWWRDCAHYSGAGLDWRYEGILIGYLNLWNATREEHWLTRAKRAGDDLRAGQLPSGNYRNSCFELNPNTGGTPHEAAADLGLLRLATVVRAQGDSSWEAYCAAAARNLTQFWIGRLWDETARSFRDDPVIPSFVPNKSATTAEAFFALARLSGEAEWAERYALPTLNAILTHQVRGDALDGAIVQNTFRGRRVSKFFPYYIVRCIPALLEGYHWNHDERYADAARRAAQFALRCRYADGSFPQVLYPNGRLNRYPQWVAAVGDILRALELTRRVGVEYEAEPSLKWLFAGARPDGSFRTAVGFGLAGVRKHTDDPRDELAVVGWCDKAFRFLSTLYPERGRTIQPA